MLQRYRNGLLAVGTIAAVALLCWLAAGGRVHPPASPLGYAPAGAEVVVHARIAALRKSPIVEQLLPALGGSAELERLCGFDPLAQVSEALVFMMGGGQEDDLGPIGLVARGAFDRERLPRCFERLMRADGATAEVTRLDGVPALSSAGGRSRAVFVGDDAVAVGSERAARGVLRAVRGEDPSAAADPVLSRLWPRVGEAREITAAMKVPSRYRQLIPVAARQHLGVTVGEVQAAVLGADLTQGIDLGLVAEMASADDAQRSTQALQQRVRTLRTEPLVAFSVLGKILRRLQIASDGPSVVMTLRVPEEDVRSLLSLLDRAKRPRRTEAPAAPDEVVEHGAAADPEASGP